MAIIGLTQRVTVNPETGEKFDSLAHGWHGFMKELGADWVPLPNHDLTAHNLCWELDVKGLILTGGDDIGAYPERDELERELLVWAREINIPVIGVCRGFQMLYTWLGGQLQECEAETHRGKRHAVTLGMGKVRTVNSYHNLAPKIAPSPTSGGLPHPLLPMAVCPSDKILEAARGGNYLGVMWHPERNPEPDQADIALFRKHLRLVHGPEGH